MLSGAGAPGRADAACVLEDRSQPSVLIGYPVDSHLCFKPKSVHTTSNFMSKNPRSDHNIKKSVAWEGNKKQVSVDTHPLQGNPLFNKFESSIIGVNRARVDTAGSEKLGRAGLNLLLCFKHWLSKHCLKKID